MTRALRLAFALSIAALAAACSSVPEWMRDGNSAPALSGSTVDGQRVDLAGERGKVAVVVFFMDSCGQCRSTYPMQRELATRMNGNPFVLIGVDGGDTPAALRDAEHRERITWPVVLDQDGTAAVAWGVGGVPQFYVIDAKGVIRGANLGAGSLFSTVDALIAEAKSAR